MADVAASVGLRWCDRRAALSDACMSLLSMHGSHMKWIAGTGRTVQDRLAGLSLRMHQEVTSPDHLPSCCLRYHHRCPAPMLGDPEHLSKLALLLSIDPSHRESKNSRSIPVERRNQLLRPSLESRSRTGARRAALTSSAGGVGLVSPRAAFSNCFLRKGVSRARLA